MASKIIDHFGRRQNSVDFRGPDPLPYVIDDQGDVTYVCFFDSPKRAIHRIKDGKVEVAYGAWADRATLTYGPVNELITVED